MSNLEATENMNQVKGDLAGPMLELLQYNITVGNDLGSLLVSPPRKGVREYSWLISSCYNGWYLTSVLLYYPRRVMQLLQLMDLRRQIKNIEISFWDLG